MKATLTQAAALFGSGLGLLTVVATIWPSAKSRQLVDAAKSLQRAIEEFAEEAE